MSQTSDGDSGSESTGADSGAEEGDTSATTAADEGTSTGDSGAPELGICGVAIDEPLAVLTSEDRTSIVFGNGSIVDLAVAPGELFGVDARGDRIAISTGDVEVGSGGIQIESTLAMFAVSGEQLWSVAEPDADVANLHVGDDGSIVAMLTHEDDSTRGVVIVDGEIAASVEGFWATGPREAGGVVPGTLSDESGANVRGWLLADGATFQPISMTPIDGWVAYDDGAYLYLSSGKGAPWLVRETIDGPVPSVLALAGTEGLRVGSSSPSWLLVEHDDAEGMLLDRSRISLATFAVESLDLTPPAGFTTLECYFPRPAIDGDGRVLLPTRDAAIAHAQRFDPGASAWDVVGQAVTDIDALEISIVGATDVVVANGAGTTFCPPQQFDGADDALAGTSTQLVHRDGESYVLAIDEWPSLREDGECAALVGPDAITLLEVGSGATIDLPAYTGVTWWSR